MNLLDFTNNYTAALCKALLEVPYDRLARARDVLVTAMYGGNHIYACGNGGSASIADHLACDCMKGVATDTLFKARVHSLASNAALLTATANDHGYDRVFSDQVAYLGRPNDVLVAISVSGTSPNVLRAIQMAVEMEMAVIVMTGRHGDNYPGACHIRVAETNYGICEDVFQSLMHILSQSIRLEFSKGEVRL